MIEDELGSLCTWLPKFHAPCNCIEYIWGNGKKRCRKECDYTMKTLREYAARFEPAAARPDRRLEQPFALSPLDVNLRQ